MDCVTGICSETSVVSMAFVVIVRKAYSRATETGYPDLAGKLKKRESPISLSNCCQLPVTAGIIRVAMHWF